MAYLMIPYPEPVAAVGVTHIHLFVKNELTNNSFDIHLIFYPCCIDSTHYTLFTNSFS